MGTLPRLRRESNRHIRPRTCSTVPTIWHHRVAYIAVMSKKKFVQLGMPIGTASNRLKKMVLLKLLRELKRDSCLRCSGIIESAKDLAIDHKRPWLDVSAHLFWDLSNIGFSHSRCNSIARRTTALAGTAWCTGHAAFLPLCDFGKNKTKWAGVQSFCESCTVERYRSNHSHQRSSTETRS